MVKLVINNYYSLLRQKWQRIYTYMHTVITTIIKRPIVNYRLTRTSERF